MIEIRPEAPDHPDARWCLDQYFSELERRFENGYRRSMDLLTPDVQFLPPGGIFLLARSDGKIAGCGAMKRADARTGEIKRIWTAPDARGKGVARQVMRKLEDAAKAMGYAMLRLDSNRALPEAHALYRSIGYRDIAPFNDDIYCHFWFGKAL
jgi:GNAT superfamily N-acetyltransferase